MLKKIIITVLSFWVITAKAQLTPYVIPNIDWIKYNNPSSGVVSSPMAIDINSNVYSTGYSGLTTSSNLLVFKYDSLGAMTYSYSYNNGNYDLGKAIKVDAAGNAYVAGVSYSTGGLNDFYVIKLSPTGTVLWSKRLDGSTHKNDEPYDIALDASGNAYVTGKTFGSGSNYDIWTVCLKYNTGALLWQNIYAGSSNLDDNGSGTVLSSNGSTVYITGNTNDTHGSNIITFALQAATGATISGWPVITDGTAHGNDYSNGIIRSGANIVICGETNNTTTGVDYTTIKYNGSSGSVIWTKKYDFLSSTNRATGLARDSADHIGVVGTALNGSTLEIHTIIYDSLGNQLQVNKESTGLTGLAADPKICNDTIAHHWYVVGSISNTSQDILVYQITPTGNTSWRKYIDGQNYDYDLGTSIGVNGVGVVYVGAHSKNSSATYDFTTIKISQTPAYYPIDLNNINEPGSPSHYFYQNKGEILDMSTGLTATNVAYYTKHVTPQEFILNDNSLAFVLTKADTSKNLTGYDTLHRVDLSFYKSNPLSKMTNLDIHDTDGILNYFLGQLSSSITNVKGSGRIMIPNLYPGIDAHFYSNNQGLKMYFVIKPGVSPSALNLLFTGAVSTSTVAGNKLQVNTHVGSFNLSPPQAYWVDQYLNTYTVASTWNNITGDRYSVNTGTYNIAWPLVIQINQNNTASYPPIDNINWSTYFGGSIGDYIYKSKTDASNSLFVAGKTISSNFPSNPGSLGYQSNSQGGYDAFLAKFNSVGKLMWSTYFGGTSSEEIRDFDFNSNDIYCVGTTSSFTLAPQSKTGAYFDNSFAGGYNDGFILQLNSTGSTNKWMTYYGEGGEDDLNACKFDASGDFFVVGSSSSTNIPVTGGFGTYQQTYNTAQLSQANAPDVLDGIIMKFNTGTSALVWATYCGTYSLALTGSSNTYDEFKSIDVNSTDIVVGGYSQGVNFPSSVNTKGTANWNDGIIAHFTTSGALTNSKYTTNLINNSLKIRNSKVYACGQAKNSMVPVNSGSYYYDGTCSTGDLDADFSVHPLTLTTTIHESFLGGFAPEEALDLQFASNGVFYVAGSTASAAFTTIPVSGAYQGLYDGGIDYFISAFKEGFTGLAWSTCLGSPQNESKATIAIDGNNNLYLCGATDSYSFIPLADGGGTPTYFQSSNAGGPNGTSPTGTITRFSLTPINTYVGIKEEEFSQFSIGLYPNPTNQYLSINNSDIQNQSLHYSIYNMAGQKVMDGNINQTNRINVTSLSSGLYIINFNTEIKSFSGKFIKAND